MHEGDDVFETLHGSEVDQTEFESVVGSYFGHGYYATPQEIYHGKTQKGCALRVLYDADGKLIGARTGPDADASHIDELRAKIEEELLKAGNAKVRRLVFFTSVPTTGYFRYRDLFQIVPVPPEAPRPKFIFGHHPFFLEFKVVSSSNLSITNFRVQRISREVELLLSSLLDYRIWTIGQETRHHWSLEISETDGVLPCKFLQEGYYWDGAVLELDDFSSPDGAEPLDSIDPSEYFSSRGITIDRKLDVSADFTSQLDKFYALSREDQDIFLRASYWFQHAHTVFTYSKSGSFVALVCAIEALMPSPQHITQCPHCKQMLGPGPTKQFVDFVEALIPGGTIPETERRRFYRMRSGLSHGGKLLAADHGAWGFTPKQLVEGHDARTMWQIVHVVVHNWLAT
jgi:hypothetical protein